MQSESRIPDSLRQVWLVARREISGRVLTRSVVLGTAALVVLLAGYLILQGAVFDRSSTTRIGLVGQAIGLETGLESDAQALGIAVNLSQVSTVTEGTDQVRDGQLDVLVSGAIDTLQVTVADHLDDRLRVALNSLVRNQALDAQLAEAGIRPSDVDGVLAKAGIRQVIQLQASDPQRTRHLAVGLVMVILLGCSLAGFGILAVRGVVEDKVGGVVEGLLAVVRPAQLFAGRLIGLGLVGLAQLLGVGLIGLLVAVVTGVAGTVGGAGAILGVLGIGLAWFALGFGLYATVLVAVASLISRPEDVGRVSTPVAVVGVVVFVLGVALLVRSPGGMVTAVLSVLPPFAPVLLPGRLALGAVPGWQLGLAVPLMVLSIGALGWVSARIYRNSLLRDESPVRLRDVLR
ncbi:MAG TPA: ABC transporter permease [Pseudonocardiaceae bacterium]|jgi:ABC-2 type transport system permease protein|nr:ABC transporter permease [Pseudonocardiaceae bacterium]